MNKLILALSIIILISLFIVFRQISKYRNDAFNERWEIQEIKRQNALCEECGRHLSENKTMVMLHPNQGRLVQHNFCSDECAMKWLGFSKTKFYKACDSADNAELVGEALGKSVS